jgi:Leucine-rich repeat (LRR) protein
LGENLQYLGESAYYQDSVVVTIKGKKIELERILTIFTTIDLSCNKFEGEIPKLLGRLTILRLLNLSHNSLTSHIPLSLANLSALESIDLSSNKLTQEIPMQLTSLTFLSMLNLSQNQLTRPIPQGKQFGTFENDSYDGNLGLCGSPSATMSYV